VGAKLMGKLRSFDIWERKNAETLIRFRCFEDLSTGRFCVQNADFYRMPVTDQYLMQLERQFIELLTEEDPFSRSGSFISIAEAIKDHEASFE